MRTSYGIEGVDYNKDAEGNITFTEKITNNPDGIRYGIAQNAFLDSFYCDPYVVLNNAYTAEQLAAVEQWSKSSCEFSFIDRLCLSYTEDELAVLETTEGIWVPVCNTSREMVLGNTPLTEWESYVETVNEAGIEEYIGVMQSAWDRFLAG
jgi:putative aldouronate transport system substrate-binding protein